MPKCSIPRCGKECDGKFTLNCKPICQGQQVYGRNTSLQGMERWRFCCTCDPGFGKCPSFKVMNQIKGG